MGAPEQTLRRPEFEVPANITRWKHRAERTDALVEVQEKVAALLSSRDRLHGNRA